ncbi:MAG: hypothetical protein AAF577_12705 [Pseudomonadota bacterium]
MRFIDDLENSTDNALPTPADVEAKLRTAQAMRGAAMARHIASFWTMLSRVTTPKPRAATHSARPGLARGIGRVGATAEG